MAKTMVHSWNDRFALIDHYKPTSEQVCSVFGVTQSEYETANSMRNTHFDPKVSTIDVNRYAGLFAGERPTATKKTTTTTHTRATTTTSEIDRPETATRKSAIVKAPQKRGRKGDKITKALMSVNATPQAVDEFMKTHGISLAVLRQAKRFAAKIEGFEGEVKVKQDKATKKLMIWRQVG